MFLQNEKYHYIDINDSIISSEKHALFTSRLHSIYRGLQWTDKTHGATIIT